MPYGSDDFIRISRPGEGLGTRIGFSDVPVDGPLRSTTERKTPRLSRWRVSLAKKLSVGCLDRWVRKRQVDYPLGHIRAKGLDPGGRVLSRSRPSTPSCMKRSCQRQTQVLEVPVRRTTLVVQTPSALSSTITARQTC
jgi:hypothetical protein